MSQLIVAERATPSTPATGKGVVWEGTDNLLWFKDSDGAISLLSANRVVALASDATTNSTSNAVKISGLDITVPAGTYVFQYFVRYQAAATTTGVKFSVNHTGTVTTFTLNMRYAGTGTTASTGAASQVINGATGNIMEAFSARAKSSAAGMGPTVSVDLQDADMLVIIEGLCIVTVSGTLELYHASEVSAASTVKAGSALILTRVL